MHQPELGAHLRKENYQLHIVHLSPTNRVVGWQVHDFEESGPLLEIRHCCVIRICRTQPVTHLTCNLQRVNHHCFILQVSLGRRVSGAVDMLYVKVSSL